MEKCLVCDRIEKIKKGENPFFVRELNTGYVVIGDSQRFKGYTLFLCKQHKSELHLLDEEFRYEFLKEMSIVAEAVYNAFKPDKLNYELLGVGNAVHMHWHIFPRRECDTPAAGPVWQIGNGVFSKEFAPTAQELDKLKNKLNKELDKLLGK